MTYEKVATDILDLLGTQSVFYRVSLHLPRLKRRATLYNGSMILVYFEVLGKIER